MPETKTSDVRDVILAYLKDNERSLSWLCRKCNFSYNTMYNCFTHRHFDLTDDRLIVINETLGTKFKK